MARRANTERITFTFPQHFCDTLREHATRQGLSPSAYVLMSLNSVMSATQVQHKRDPSHRTTDQHAVEAQIGGVFDKLTGSEADDK